MGDFKTLVDEAREWGEREAEELGEDSYSARTLTDLADAVEALVAEREAMAVEWGVRVYGSESKYDVLWTTNEADAPYYERTARIAAEDYAPAVPVTRLVGPWTPVEEKTND